MGKHICSVIRENYQAEIDEKGCMTLVVRDTVVFSRTLFVGVTDATGFLDEDTGMVFEDECPTDGETVFTFAAKSGRFPEKKYIVTCGDDTVSIACLFRGTLPLIDEMRFLGNGGCSTGLSRLHAPRFDWSRGTVFLSPGVNDSLACQQWLSPPPFSWGLDVGGAWITAGLSVPAGQNNFQSFDYRGSSGFGFALTYEGHLDIAGLFLSPALVFNCKAEMDPYAALRNYTDWLEQKGRIVRTAKNIPAWWREPFFCGWGEQRLQYRSRHDKGESGNWIHAGDMATEALYRRSLAALEANGIDPGVVIVDCFWSERPSLAEPDPLKWNDLRAFIDEQHAKGRHVLLWITPIIFAGLPVEACMTLDGMPVATDPTSETFRRLFAEEIRKMISPEPGCLDADGFKVDFTQNIPAEKQVFRSVLSNKWAIITEDENKRYPAWDGKRPLVSTAKPLWGLEIVKAYISSIAEPMKRIKKDSLLVTHAVNPYLADDFDMLRLNDMDGVSPDVLEIMGSRAAIAKACNPNWLIDTDNDLMVSRKKWRDYIKLQAEIGVPDTYYATGIAVSGESFKESDYALLRKIWAEYRRKG